MDKLTLRQDVALIFIMTDELKARIIEETKAAVDDAQRQVEQFDFRARHALAELQRTDLNRAMAARQQIEAEKNRLEAMKKELEERLEETQAYQLGAEYQRGTIEGVTELQVGDNLFEKLAGVQLVVKDNLIVDIRIRKMNPEDVIIPQPSVLEQSAE